MLPTIRERVTNRYNFASEEKSSGATYTPKSLADFVARQIARNAGVSPSSSTIRILDPAVGDGELLVSLLGCLPTDAHTKIEVYGFDTDPKALSVAGTRINQLFPLVAINFEVENFLEFVLEHFDGNGDRKLFCASAPELFDLIIANPPYVRTQILGADQTRFLAKQFGLSGRVDLYYAFILAMARVLRPQGIAGIIVSNRFMTTRSGASVRKALLEEFKIRHTWDLGDTKIFDAAVLPAVLLLEGKNNKYSDIPAFTSIYQTNEPAICFTKTLMQALEGEGPIQIEDGRTFHVMHGNLDTSGKCDGVWRIATEGMTSWLDTVNSHCWGTFRDIGKVRVGVKTCADKVFIRADWLGMEESELPELLRPVVTHHVARRYKPLELESPKKILYPHETVQGRNCAVDLSGFPRSREYLERHQVTLKDRKYVTEAGRQWYEIWVPQDPSSWSRTKLVFRDIAEKPTFWIDHDGSVVNGDCYWLICRDPAQSDLLWLAAAVGNSTFIERFYDYSFNNKLYAGRRRFITQYVEKFPLPDPGSHIGKSIISMAKRIYECTPSIESDEIQMKLDAMVWEAFGLPIEKVCR